ncbi:hypothetical protein F8388_014674 [Cannabis sativa]|uniref:DUF7890 domain-containing protein n=1 Tax=Cannabis sativa TaxID=3483 RepID=A0A7J6E4H7_CANSA|nr:hypothetical protein F8388_014674 [Cannabis sativa]
MLNTLVSFLNKISVDEMLRTTNNKEIIYRDELSNNKNKKKNHHKKSKKENSSPYYSLVKSKEEPLLPSKENITTTTTTITTTRQFCCEEIEEKKVMRVKVTMTKQDAARLLSKCKEGGKLDFKDVALELVNIPVDRVSVDLSPNPTSCSSFSPKKVMLQSICEEC